MTNNCINFCDMNTIYDTLGLRYAATRRADTKIVASIAILVDLHTPIQI
jgi:hypothetical protein